MVVRKPSAREPDASWKRYWRDDSATDPLMSAHVNRRQLGKPSLAAGSGQAQGLFEDEDGADFACARDSGVLSRVSGGFRI